MPVSAVSLAGQLLRAANIPWSQWFPVSVATAQPGMRRNRSTAQHAPPASAPPSEETTTAASKDSTTTSTAPAPKRDDLEDPTGNWTFQVLGQKWGLLQGRVKLDCDASVPLDAEQRLFLKAALLQMLRTCVDLFQANTSIDYDHWLEDPVLLQVFQEIFQRHFSVLGLMCSLRPWKRKVPDPYLSSLCAPLWLLIDGDMRHWQVHAVEDMRMMSHNQLHLPVDDALDGDVSADLLRPPADPDGDPDGPRGSSSRARRSATFARRAAPLAPSERENDGGNAPGAEAEGPEIEAEADQGEDFDAVRQEPEDDKVLKPKPLFDFKKVFKRLQSGLIDKDPATAKRLLLGLHERFYHAPIGDFKNMLLRAGLSSDV